MEEGGATSRKFSPNTSRPSYGDIYLCTTSVHPQHHQHHTRIRASLKDLSIGLISETRGSSGDTAGDTDGKWKARGFSVYIWCYLLVSSASVEVINSAACEQEYNTAPMGLTCVMDDFCIYPYLTLNIINTLNPQCFHQSGLALLTQ